MGENMKIVTFNVNSLKAMKQYYKDLLKLSFNEFLNDILEADIVCFQETKINSEDKVDQEFLYLYDFDAFFAFHRRYKKIGYSGTATFVRKKFPVFQVETTFTGHYEKSENLLAEYGQLNEKFSAEELAELDAEGRVVITDHGLFVLFNVYFPNDGLEHRMPFKLKFYRALQLRAEVNFCFILGFAKSGATCHNRGRF